MSNRINRPEPPALPLAPQQYGRPWADSLLNVLRLFFNQVVTSYGKLLDPDSGGRFLFFPHAKYFNDTTIDIVAADTPQELTYNNTVVADGVSLVSGSQLTVERDGYYMFSFHGTAEKATAVAADVTFWFRKNGVDVEHSAQKTSVGANRVAISIELSLIIDMNVNDYIEVIASSTLASVDFVATAATGSIPAIPSARVDVTFVSND